MAVCVHGRVSIATIISVYVELTLECLTLVRDHAFFLSPPIHMYIHVSSHSIPINVQSTHTHTHTHTQ